MGCVSVVCNWGILASFVNKSKPAHSVKSSTLLFSIYHKNETDVNLTSGRPTPLDIFGQFFDGEILRLLCSSINKNVARNQERGRKFQWRDVSAEELKKFLGLLLYMDVLELPRMTDLWRKTTIFRVPFPSTVMSRDRFKAILSSVHISDPEEDVRNEQAREQEGFDCLHRVRPLLELMRTRCMAAYHPWQHIAVDERMVGTKARLSFKQYMREKPTKWGLKFFVLADTNGYTVDYRFVFIVLFLTMCLLHIIIYNISYFVVYLSTGYTLGRTKTVLATKCPSLW